MQPLVSITLSAYNVEKYIKKNLDCIVNQTLREIEIICIDDGSTDNTLSILKKYASEDERIIVVSKAKNEGLAVARNESLELASGRYIAFVDGDDLFDLTLFEKAYRLSQMEKTDMVMWDYQIFYDEKELEIISPSSLNKTQKNKRDLLKRPAFTWIKLIKTDVAKSLNISFPKGLTRQDIPIHWLLITQIDKISILPEKLSYYRQQLEATTHKNDKRLFDIALVLDIVKKYLEDNNLFEIYKNIFLESQLNMLFGMFDKVEDSLKKEALEILKVRLNEIQWEYINSKKPLRYQARIFYKSLKGAFFAKIKYKLWKKSRKIYRFAKGRKK